MIIAACKIQIYLIFHALSVKIVFHFACLLSFLRHHSSWETPLEAAINFFRSLLALPH